MYQCQMGKQTMGTPIQTWRTNADTKLYRLQTPATPLFRPTHYDNIGLDDYPMGTNAIVAVISYTVSHYKCHLTEQSSPITGENCSNFPLLLEKILIVYEDWTRIYINNCNCLQRVDKTI